ncbi:MAG TPA: sulfur transferase domain-containing protein [Thermoanaerobaculia bacterium]|nr:sulfur transferase domain-containing protein [Thermoanaerobaculia bacterium]
MKTSLPLALLLAAALAATAAEIPASVDPAEIPNYRKLGPGLAVAGEPAPDALKKLGTMGFRTVISLRASSEGFGRDRVVVEEQGLRWVNVPVSPATFTARDAEAVAKVLDDPAAGPTFLYCASANRVGGVWAVYQAMKGKSLDEALAEGKKAGLRSQQMIEAVEKVIRTP